MKFRLEAVKHTLTKDTVNLKIESANPSVITLNAVSVSHALNEFLFDFLDLRLKTRRQCTSTITSLQVKHNVLFRARDSDCYECSRGWEWETR